MESHSRGRRTREPGGIAVTFRALRYRNYRLFFAGQLISVIGTWMQQVALTWLVYRLTGSPFLLGIVGFAGQMPLFLVSPFAGVLADRHNRHRMVIATQTLAMVQAAVLTFLTLTGTITVWQIIVLSAFIGIVNAFDIPTRQSFLLDMIETKEDLSNAIALNSSMFNSARLIGPAIAGVVIAALGEGLCFLLNTVSYIAVIAALLAMRINRKHPPQKPPQRVMEGFTEGFRYAFGFKPIRNILALLAVVSMMGMPYAVLMPVFAKDILHGGPETFGFLMGAVGIGALAGALTLATRKSVVGLTRWIPAAAAIFGLGVVAFSLSRLVWLSAFLLFVVGVGMMTQMASSNTILQTVADDDKRGRVMSFYTMSFMGMTPFGSLFAGSLAAAIGAPLTLLMSGMVCVIGAFVFARQLPAMGNEIRTTYIRLGIISAPSSGLQAATDLTVPPE